MDLDRLGAKLARMYNICVSIPMMRTRTKRVAIVLGALLVLGIPPVLWS